jgi:3-hydroxyisobutyrate dehydrogenase-like beta-hydroxyacid dehydrogenase
MAQVSLIGLGGMGAAMAMRLLETGHALTVWNRSPGRAEPLVAAGATLATSLETAAAAAPLVATMLSDDTAVLTVAKVLAERMVPGALHVSMSTVAPETSEKLAELHAAHGQSFLAAPVFGRPPAAAAGQLFTLSSGSDAALKMAAPLFDAVGKAHFHLGSEPGQANVAKLAGNYMIMATTAAVGEALSVGQSHGIAPASLLALFTGTLFDSPIHRNYGAMLVEHRFRPAGFTADLGRKDVGLFAATAEAGAVRTPLADLLLDQLGHLIASHGADIDWAAIGMLSPSKETPS